MNNKNFYFLSVVSILLCFSFTTNTVHAAEVYFAPHTGNIYPGDTFVLEARISSPYELINVADGAFLFDKDLLEVKELSVGGSVFSLWATGPSFSNTDGRVSFVGGTPKGFQDSNGLIIKAIFHAKKEGKTTVFFESGFSLLLSDGNGTKISPQIYPRTLTVVQRLPQVLPKDEWKDLIETDTTPPEFIEAIISKDSQFFDGKYFISFFATDNQSGVTYYEIKEGDNTFVRGVSPYLLQDQTLAGAIQIKSVDSAGNESVITPQSVLIPHIPFYKTILFWIVVLLLFVLGVGVFSRLRMKY